MEYFAPKSRLGVTTGPRGEVVSVRSGGEELCVPAAEAFTLQLLDKEGNELTFESSRFSYDGKVWSGHPDMPGLTVEMKISAGENHIAFRPRVTGVPSDWVLSWFDGPQICYPRHRGIDLVHPLHDGVIVSEPLPPKEYHPIGFAKRGVFYGSFYPGRCQMQFMALCRENHGVYFAAHDPASATKAVEYDVTERQVRLSLQTFTGCDFGSGYAPEWDYVLRGFEGHWQEAAELYRSWYESADPLAEEAAFPKWMERSPVVLIYPVRGHGKDTGDMEPNCYFPYTNMLPHVERLNALLDSPVMALPMHWEGTAPWAPPYVWPPFGGEENFFAFRDALHAKGNLLGVYCSGTAWTCSSSILPEYAPGCTPEQEKMMLRGPRGELEATVCNGPELQRLGYDLCLTEEPARRIVREEILKLARAGIDYAQFYDQNHGGCVHNCFARDHHHPPVPGPWQTAMQREFLREVAAGIGSLGKNLVLGCESAAADPYVRYLPLNDARSSFMYRFGEPIPLQQFVLHGRTANFAGNQGGVGLVCDFTRSPHSLNRRLAYAFRAGDLLSAILKEDGQAHWCWSCEWSRPGPPQEPFWRFAKNLNACRRANPEFLLRGTMQRDFFDVSGGSSAEFDLQGKEKEYPAFCHSSWRAKDGKRALFAANYLDREQTLVIDGKRYVLPPCSALKLDPESGETALYGE